MLKFKHWGTASYSEMRTWTTCRKQWYWKYVVGISPKKVCRTPYFGVLGHMALDKLYSGICMEEIDQILTKHVQTEFIDTQKLFDEDAESFMGTKDTVMEVIKRYDEFYDVSGGQEKFTPVSNEMRFEVPLPKNKIRLAGYLDMIVKDEENKYWILEHKFPKQFKDEEWTDLDGQIGAYQYAVRKLGYPVIGTIYNQVIQKLPSKPTMNKNGKMSVAQINTDWDTYEQCLLDAGLDPSEYKNEMMPKLSGVTFFKRHYIYRSEREIEYFAKDMNRKVFDMCRCKNHIYRTDNNMVCKTMCSFRNLCGEELRGGDVQWIIDNDFEAYGRRKTVTEEEDE